MIRSGIARKYNPATLSPRVKVALRLYGSGAVPTMGKAADAAGLGRSTFYQTRHKDSRVDIYLARIDKEIDEGTVEMSKVLMHLGRKAVVGIAKMADDDSLKPDVRLRANIDLADRSPETMKTHKIKLEEDIKLTPESIESLRSALAESARSRVQFAQVISGDYITVDAESSVRHLAQLPAPFASSNGTGHPDP